MVPEVPITWMYNAFVWKMHAQISGLPNSDQHLQLAAPHSSLMLGNQVIDYSARKDVALGFIWNERKKKKKKTTRSPHRLDIKQEYFKILGFF